MRVGNPPDGEAFDNNVLLVCGQIFGTCQAGEQDALVHPDNAVERSHEVEAWLGDDPDHPPEACNEAVLGDVHRGQGRRGGKDCRH